MTGRARWLSASEACGELGIDEPQLLRMIDHGKIPGYRIGRHIQLRRVDVERAAYLLDLEVELAESGEQDRLRPPLV